MLYSKEFLHTVTEAVAENVYIGTGNPNAPILIVGKELGFDAWNEEQYKIEVEDNVKQWQSIIEYGDDYPERHNPLWYGYGGIKSPGHTWNKYNYLHNLLFEPCEKKLFSRNIFLTELNTNPSRYSSHQIANIRQQSITQRVQFMRNSMFFQSFPIVIMANGSYCREYSVSIEKLFEVKWSGKVESVGPGNWYSLHFNANHSKIVIHTRQLSMNVSNQLLKAIAEEIKSFGYKNYK